MRTKTFSAQCTRYAALVAMGIGIASITDAHAQVFSEIGSIASPTQARELLYSPAFSSLVLRNTASAVALVSTTGGGGILQFANNRFTDISLSPDGRYVYAADFGGENFGYGNPPFQSYVHRADLTTGNWAVKTATLAGRVEATSADTFVLQSLDQWVTFTNNAWGLDGAVTQLNTNSPGWSGYFARVYSGELRYSPTTGRLIHGNSGLSSNELQVFKIQDKEFSLQEGSGIYGSADGYGGSLALATDESRIYYGRLVVDAIDVTHNLMIFPEPIYAATADIAFGNGRYYSAKTGALLGNLGFSTTVYGLNADGTDFWAYDQSTNQLRHFAMAVPEPTSFVLMFAGGIALVCVRRRRAKRHFP